MRPVEKGTAPQIFAEYVLAYVPLRDQIGEYCSYCERPCDLQVEHIEPISLAKYKHRERDWDNFLLACDFCNRQKWDNDPRLQTHYFPHEVNTAYAFGYDETTNEVVSRFDPVTHPIEHSAAMRTIALVDLNRFTDSYGRIDKRRLKRQGAWGVALEAYKRHCANPPIDTKDIESIRALALATGFFGIWLSVFANMPAVRTDLIANFPHTRTGCYDPATGDPIPDLTL